MKACRRPSGKSGGPDGADFCRLRLSRFAGASVDNHYAAARKEEQIRRDNLASITMEKVGQYVREGKTVIVTVSADWCLTCRFNDIMVLKTRQLNKNPKPRGGYA